jgi:amidohydrolase
MTPVKEQLSPVDHIRAYHAELREIRRDLHAHPELAFDENRTSSVVVEYLKKFGIETHTGLARTGVVGVIRGKKEKSGKGVGLRADMDCLPMHETGEVPYRSRHEGRMHACGHDGHTTMLLGAARYLAETRNFDGTAYLIFQPAEENGGGGQVMVQEGLFERFPANEIYALHNWPIMPPGIIAVRPGPMMAATDEVQITVRGQGGHAAVPQLTVDPVVAAAHIITALQTIASRNVDPLDAVVVSICSMATSQIGAFNVIPEAVQLIGTVRSFKPETRDLAEQKVRSIAAKIAEALGATAEVKYSRGYPATVNSAREAAFAARVGEQVFG